MRPSLCRCNDVLSVVAEDRRAGHEFCRRLREPVFQLQRLCVERHDRVRLAITGRLARADRRNESAVGCEGDLADHVSTVGLPRHDGLRLAVEIDGPYGTGRAAAVSCRRRIERRVHQQRARTIGRWQAGMPRGAGDPCPTPGRARAACRRSRRRNRHRMAERAWQTPRSLPVAALPECDRRLDSRPAGTGGAGAPRRVPPLRPEAAAEAEAAAWTPPARPRPAAGPSTGTPSPGSPSRLRYPTAPRPPKLSAAPGAVALTGPGSQCGSRRQ